MDRIRAVRSGNYTVLDNSITRNHKASMEAKGLLLTVFSLPPDWDFTMAGLATITKESKNSLYRIVRELIELGYCTRTPRPKKQGRYVGTDYTFFENPDRISKTVSHFQDTENGTQLNIDKVIESENSDSSHTHTQEYVHVNGEYVGTSEDFFANLEETGPRQGEQQLLIDVEVPDWGISTPIPEVAHKHMYKVCYLAETVEQQMFLDSKQRGRVASVLGKLRDADADFNRVLNFEEWWRGYWKSRDKISKQYQPPTPEQVLEHWTMAMSSLNGTGPKQQERPNTPTLQEVEAVLRRKHG